MSLVQTAMFKDQLKQLGHHSDNNLIKSRSHNELIQLNGSISANLNTTTTTRFNNKRRSLSDDVIDSTHKKKRSRTAPPSPPPSNDSSFSSSTQLTSESPSADEKSSTNLKSLRSRSLSPVKRFFNPLSPSNSPRSSPIITPKETPEIQKEEDTNEKQQQEQPQVVPPSTEKITLPSISAVLGTAEKFKQTMKLKPITPTVSLDYFDTYKPNDENWRYELLDKITKESKLFNLNQYNYLNKHATESLPNITRSSAISPGKPNFDSRISSKITTTMLPKLHSDGERKINFPYESNYTYLNKTYLNDVKKYPEYLELAQSLMSLSQPEQYSSLNSSSFSSASHQNYSNSSYVVSSPINNYNNGYSNNLPSLMSISQKSPVTPQQQQLNHKLIPFSPPSSGGQTKVASRSDLIKSPPRQHSHHHHHNTPRVCISCGSDQSPCWRPSWSIKEGQLCNSCGLRYKKTSARCLNESCRKIPAKGEWSLMQSKGKIAFGDGIEGYSCLECGWRVEVKK
ncbi:uncharacterized protein SPAPADRAFT_70705 [Spathaspora passalidarum NRRL Y-27907]|uniref:GATA-type domain-containing protein n=1 Tax=Spathaspora passalidarum (strain NRRL Y-27907 / 11-Y1) TaxID=619300 RepID=G3ALU3_SPAPN|nr:uncharacterized protein SPAPADRAFT_70705 [Spathaspora passalidarum NRRL Y-27907]EGW32702.1 hypothetical protein SPAPADRAFT_70705 [Spathaspora passalidarum NRRL Y-27907]